MTSYPANDRPRLVLQLCVGSNQIVLRLEGAEISLEGDITWDLRRGPAVDRAVELLSLIDDAAEKAAIVDRDLVVRFRSGRSLIAHASHGYESYSYTDEKGTWVG